MPEPWRIHFFHRHRDDDPARDVPTITFLDNMPVRARFQVIAVLDAVAEALPPAFSGGGKWEAMHRDMAGFYEVRVRGADRRNHRLFCVLEREAPDLGGPSIVCIGGLSKPLRAAAHPRDYGAGGRVARGVGFTYLVTRSMEPAAHVIAALHT